MSKRSRREFIQNSGLSALGIGLASTGLDKISSNPKQNIFVHQVYFWLKDPGNPEDVKSLIKGLDKLSKIKTIIDFHIGKPAGSTRDVIENSYSISWLTIFKTAADQDSYQTDPIHLKFIEECKHLWSKVVVYDSVDA